MFAYPDERLRTNVGISNFRGPEWEAISIMDILTDWEYLEEVREKVGLLV